MHTTFQYSTSNTSIYRTDQAVLGRPTHTEGARRVCAHSLRGTRIAEMELAPEVEASTLSLDALPNELLLRIFAELCVSTPVNESLYPRALRCHS